MNNRLLIKTHQTIVNGVDHACATFLSYTCKHQVHLQEEGMWSSTITPEGEHTVSHDKSDRYYTYIPITSLRSLFLEVEGVVGGVAEAGVGGEREPGEEHQLKALVTSLQLFQV